MEYFGGRVDFMVMRPDPWVGWGQFREYLVLPREIKFILRCSGILDRKTSLSALWR